MSATHQFDEKLFDEALFDEGPVVIR